MTPPAPGSVVHKRDEHLGSVEVAEAARLCGASSAEPLAAAFVLALRAAMASGALPGGAIMLAHRATWFTALREGDYRTEMRIRSVDPPRTRFQRVVIGYETRDADGALVLEQAQEVLWPAAS